MSNLQSKKFIAFLIAEMTWKLLIAVAFVFGISNGKMETDFAILLGSIVFISGYVEVAYISKQAALDQYVHLAQTVTRKEKGLVPDEKE